MLLRSTTLRRRGGVVIECAIVYPVTFLLLLGLVVGGLGVFRYQQTAALAREGARYAVVRGAQYKTDTDKPAVTEADLRNYVRGRAAGLNPNDVQCTVRWNQGATAYNVNFNNGITTVTVNTVSVTVTYNWFPEAYLIGPIRLSSTSTMPMSY